MYNSLDTIPALDRQRDRTGKTLSLSTCYAYRHVIKWNIYMLKKLFPDIVYEFNWNKHKSNLQNVTFWTVHSAMHKLSYKCKPHTHSSWITKDRTLWFKPWARFSRKNQ